MHSCVYWKRQSLRGSRSWEQEPLALFTRYYINVYDVCVLCVSSTFFFYNWTCNWSALPSSLLGNLGPRRRNCEDSSGHKDTQWKHRTKSQWWVYGCELFTIKPYFTFYHHLKNKNAREWIYWKCPFHQQCKTNNRHKIHAFLYV